MPITYLGVNPPGKIIERDLDLFTGTGHKVILVCDLSPNT
jgi:hypothetical protein